MPSRPDQSDATHRLLVRGEGRDRVDAANAVIEAALAVGDVAYLSVRDVDRLADLSPHTHRILTAELERVPTGERVTTAERPEFRADLPADADDLVAALTVRGDLSHGEAGWRAWDVYALAVVAGGEWLYYAIPHEGQFYLRADAAPSFPDRAAEAVAPYPSSVVPTGPIVTWGGGRYRLDHRTLQVGGARHRLDILKRAVVDPGRGEVVFEWLGPYERPSGADGVGESLFSLAVTTLLLPLELLTDRPGRVDVGDAETAERVESALRDVAESVGYDYEVERR